MVPWQALDLIFCIRTFPGLCQQEYFYKPDLDVRPTNRINKLCQRYAVSVTKMKQNYSGFVLFTYFLGQRRSRLWFRNQINLLYKRQGQING